MPAVRLSRLADTDLLEIFLHISADNARAAENLLHTIDVKCGALAVYPKMGRIRNELGAGLRSFPVSSYIIFFRQTPEGIEVLRVLHAARDVISHFTP